VEIIDCVKAPIKSMLLPVLYEFALYRSTTDDNVLQKGQYLLLKMTGVVTGLLNNKLS
jgi:hypothetical protein